MSDSIMEFLGPNSEGDRDPELEKERIIDRESMIRRWAREWFEENDAKTRQVMMETLSRGAQYKSLKTQWAGVFLAELIRLDKEESEDPDVS